MNSKVFFSILIPTKNRSHLVCKAIDSVLNQSFDNFEIVVVDNDDSDDTQTLISKISDHRIKYYRTGGLSMVENWEFGRKKTTGQFLTVLEDKQAYYPWALEWLNKSIKEQKVDVVAWNWDIKQNQRPAPPDERCRITQTSDVLNDYVNAEHPWKKLPRMINSCVSQEIVKKICEKTLNNNFFTYFSPDICAAFMQLALVDKLYTTNCRIGFLSSEESNAIKFITERDNKIPYFSGNKDMDIHEAVDMVVIKQPYLIHNIIYNDYLHVRKLFPESLKQYKMTPLAYSKTCLLSILVIMKVNGKIKNELFETISYMFKHLNIMEQYKLWHWFVKSWYQQKN